MDFEKAYKAAVAALWDNFINEHKYLEVYDDYAIAHQVMRELVKGE